MDVIYEPEAARQFLQLPRSIQARISRIAIRLRGWPNVSGVKPLRGLWPVISEFEVAMIACNPVWRETK